MDGWCRTSTTRPYDPVPSVFLTSNSFMDCAVAREDSSEERQSESAHSKKAENNKRQKTPRPKPYSCHPSRRPAPSFAQQHYDENGRNERAKRSKMGASLKIIAGAGKRERRVRPKDDRQSGAMPTTRIAPSPAFFSLLKQADEKKRKRWEPIFLLIGLSDFTGRSFS